MNIKIFMIMIGVSLWFLLSVAGVGYIVLVLVKSIKSRKEKKRFEEYLKETHFEECLYAKRIKSKALCNACEYERYCADRTNDCETCGQYDVKNICKCYEIDNGEECKYFKPIESEVNNNEN